LGYIKKEKSDPYFLDNFTVDPYQKNSDFQERGRYECAGSSEDS
jgi:hypothetical protein